RMVGDLLLAHCDPLAEKVQIAVHTRRAISSLRVRALVDACASRFWPKWGSDCSQTPQEPRPRYLPWPVLPSIRRASLGGQIGGLFLRSKSGRGEWIRTTGLLVPNQALYQAEPRPDTSV